MHVAVDGRSLRPGTGRARGVARYLRCLLDELARAYPEDTYSVVDPGSLRLAASALTGRPRLDRLAPGCDVAWVPAPAPVAVSRGVPLVLTVHDLSFEHRPPDYSLYARAWHRLARPARLAQRAERVLCVSEATRHALVEEWGVDAQRARTVLSGPGRPAAAGSGAAGSGGGGAGAAGSGGGGSRGAAAGSRGAAAGSGATAAAAFPAGVPDEFVLAVGALEPRKLPGLLVDAHRRARAGGLRAGLVFAGDGPLRARLERSGASVLGHVSDDTLDALYERALAVCCVSREEGFGFTPLEALARGTPVVVGDLPVFEETVGEGALRVPPRDAGALADALLRLERDPALRERLADAGGEAVARLSWERAARETRELLAEAAGAP
jgi:glycosyltransferase involved in cell wall biosynthesis